MRDFRPSNKKGYSRGRDAGRPSMHNAVCDECNKQCKVPFKPTGDKPVFCSDCFEHQSGSRSGGRDFGRRDSGRHEYRERGMHSAICDDCGNRCEVPFRPTGGKPIFCDACFSGTSKPSKKRGDKGGDNRQLQEQINAINGKLDNILQTLESLIVVEEEEPKKKPAKKKPAKKKPVKKPTKKKPTKKAAPKKK